MKAPLVIIAFGLLSWVLVGYAVWMLPWQRRAQIIDGAMIFAMLCVVLAGVAGLVGWLEETYDTLKHRAERADQDYHD